MIRLIKAEVKVIKGSAVFFFCFAINEKDAIDISLEEIKARVPDLLKQAIEALKKK